MPRRADDEDDFDADDIDRDPDAAYRARSRGRRYERDPEDAREDEEERRRNVADAPRRCRVPAVGLMVTSLVGMGGNATIVALNVPAGGGPGVAATWIVLSIYFGLPLVAGFICAILTFFGGLALLRGRGRGLALTGAILACFPCQAGFLIGLPFALWTFRLLGDWGVQDWFDRRR